LGSEVVLIVRELEDDPIVMERSLEFKPGGDDESFTWSLKLNCPVALGVPEMLPLGAFTAMPGGIAPAVTLQL
jgi:hypothetical protein